TIIGTLVVSGEEMAISRDEHYHKPPEYLTIEPLDTTSRTANLQQSNVNGYKLQIEQSDSDSLNEARIRAYYDGAPHTAEAQIESHDLMNALSYRLDTNFAKIDRIDNADVENFKREVLQSIFLGRTLQEWKSVFASLASKDLGKRGRAEAEIESLYSVFHQEEVKTTVVQESRDAH